jgi:hypothetical protein
MILVIALVTPFTMVLILLVVVAKLLESIMLEVELIPLTNELKVLEATLKVLVVEEAKMALIFPITAFAIVVVPSRDKLVKPLMVVVEVIPLTTLVIKLVVEEKLKLLVVVAAIKEASEVVEITPLTLVVITPVLVAKVTVLLDMTDEVALTPFTVVVSVLPLSVVVRELMILVNKVETPLTMEAKVLVVVLSVFEFTKLVVVVEITPFTLEVKVKLLVVVDIAKVLVVVEVSPEREVVALTPLIVVVKMLVEVANDEELEEITLDVAETPFTVVVKTLPLSVVVSELMILVNKVLTPLTIEAKVFVVVLNVFEFTKLVVLVEMIPLTLEVKIKLFVVVAIESKFVVLEAIKLDNEVVAITPLMVVVNNPVDVAYDKILELTEVVVETIPLTVLVITLPRDKTLLLFIKLKVVVARTPLVELTNVIELVVLALVRVLLVTIDEVAETPLTVEVRVLPAAD